MEAEKLSHTSAEKLGAAWREGERRRKQLC
jgi:hypothetical protein